MMTYRHLYFACASLLVLSACEGDVDDLEITDAAVTQQSCTGAFVATSSVKNPTGDTIKGSPLVTSRTNLTTLSSNPSGQATYGPRSVGAIRFDGQATDPCQDVNFKFRVSGDNDVTPEHEGDVDGVIRGEDLAQTVSADPQTGAFSYQVRYTCCGVGFANPYQLTGIIQENVANLDVMPDQFNCQAQEPHDVTISGILPDKTKQGELRVKIEDRARDVDCMMDRVVDPGG